MADNTDKTNELWDVSVDGSALTDWEIRDAPMPQALLKYVGDYKVDFTAFLPISDEKRGIGLRVTLKVAKGDPEEGAVLYDKLWLQGDTGGKFSRPSIIDAAQALQCAGYSAEAIQEFSKSPTPRKLADMLTGKSGWIRVKGFSVPKEGRHMSLRQDYLTEQAHGVNVKANQVRSLYVPSSITPATSGGTVANGATAASPNVDSQMAALFGTGA